MQADVSLHNAFESAGFKRDLVSPGLEGLDTIDALRVRDRRKLEIGLDLHHFDLNTGDRRASGIGNSSGDGPGIDLREGAYGKRDPQQNRGSSWNCRHITSR